MAPFWAVVYAGGMLEVWIGERDRKKRWIANEFVGQTQEEREEGGVG